ncbi:MAG: DUF3592 domain-containing protein [Acidobacteria bacterium]|nr:DUF3592 domain-containing protein [Acidobacteriota bacterium]
MTSGRSDWQITPANVYSVDWIDPSRNDWGHYEVVYSYRVGNDFFTGRFSDYGSPAESYLKRDDTIHIRYNPSNSKKSFYPDARQPSIKKVSLALIGVGIGLLVMLIVYLSGGFNS